MAGTGVFFLTSTSESVLPGTAAFDVLLTSDDLADTEGAMAGVGSDPVMQALSDYVAAAQDSKGTSIPADCGEEATGMMSLAAVDTEAYEGWAVDEVWTMTGIVAAGDGYGGEQQSRHFVDVASAQAFLRAQADWYDNCAVVDFWSSGDVTTFQIYDLPSYPGIESLVVTSESKGGVDGSSGVTMSAEAYLRRANVVVVLVLPNQAALGTLDSRVEQIIEVAAARLAVAQ